MHCSRRTLVIAAALVAALAFTPQAQSAVPAAPGDDVVRQATDLVHRDFFDVKRIPDFDAAVEKYRARAGARYDYRAAISEGLAALKASHTEFYTAGELDYYELLDIFNEALAVRDGARLKVIFPPDGLPRYDGIGIVARHTPAGWYISDIYDASPAAKADLKVGDLVKDVDGAAFDPIGSFRGKAGRLATLTVVSSTGGPQRHVAVPVVSIRPNAMTDASITASVRTLDVAGAKVGYLHLWTYSTPNVQELVQKLLTGAPLRDVAGLILDMRCRHGGAPPDAGDMFVGATPELEMTGRSASYTANFRYRKPLVGLIDGGTRSGMEILAYTLKKAGIVLVGERTAGAVLGGSPFLLKDGSLLYLAVMGGLVDGHPLEGVGVVPNVVVAFDKRFSDGRDPQLDAAVTQMGRVLRGNSRPG